MTEMNAAQKLVQTMKRIKRINRRDRLYEKQQDVNRRAVMYCAQAMTVNPHVMLFGSLEMIELQQKTNAIRLDVQLMGLQQEMTAFRKSLSE